VGILDVHADDLVQAGRNTLYVPPPRPPAKFNAWGLTTAAPRGVTAGAAESGGFLADVTGAFGQVLAATDPLIGMTAPADVRDRLKQGQDEAQRRMQQSGVSYSSEAGDLLRGVASGYRPDAQTASMAERLVFDFSRVAAKAVGYTVAGGPVVGPLLTGADEGMAAADELRQQGVDLGTRTKAGAVIGAVTALGVGLPMAGTTAAQTAGLVALGGPVSFSGQQLAVRGILQNAGYDEISMQYDPLDPVGLAVSTLLPAGFGAYALRSRAKSARAAESGPPLNDRAAAEGEVAAQPIDAPAAPEVVDAARVALQAEQRQAASLGRPDDLRAQQAHETALTRAEDQLAAGERVEVADAALPAPERLMQVAEAMVSVRSRIADELGVDPWDVPAQGPEPALTLRPAAEVADELRSMARAAGWSQEGGRLLRSGVDEAGDGGMGGGVVGRTQWIPGEEWFGRMRAELGRNGLARRSDIEAAVEKFIEGQPLKATEQRTVDWLRTEQAEMARRFDSFDDGADLARASFDAGLSSRDAGDLALVARAAEIDPDAVERLAVMHETDDAAFMAAIKEITDANPAAPDDASAGAGGRGAEAGAAQPADAGAARADGGGEGAGGGRSGAGAGADGAESAAVAQRLAAVAAEFPDLTVRMDGMDAPMRLSDFLAAVKAEADADLADAPLYQVAAECALLNAA
jgi:hypothetical protein